MEQPAFATNEHLRFLDRLSTMPALATVWSMWPYLDTEFDELDAPKAQEVLRYWLHHRGHPD